MTDDVERLLEETSEQSEPKQSKSSTFLELLNIYKMPNLSQEQLNAFSKNYKVCQYVLLIWLNELIFKSLNVLINASILSF